MFYHDTVLPQMEMMQWLKTAQGFGLGKTDKNPFNLLATS